MISNKEIKEIAKKEKKKIGEKAVKILNKIIKDKINDIIKKAAQNAEFYGRNTIREIDIKEVML
ncbi:MAG: hypothetical protein KJ559_03210 [Nanoarchaeota archaeon]|nr:hypothetical protein [Nanoarchaeota archaeon]